MYDRLKRLYDSGSLDETGLQRAVSLGWITVEEKEQIMNSEIGGNEE